MDGVMPDVYPANNGKDSSETDGGLPLPCRYRSEAVRKDHALPFPLSDRAAILRCIPAKLNELHGSPAIPRPILSAMCARCSMSGISPRFSASFACARDGPDSSSTSPPWRRSAVSYTTPRRRGFPFWRPALSSFLSVPTYETFQNVFSRPRSSTSTTQGFSVIFSESGAKSSSKHTP